jgi:hypothetical protein
MPEDSELERGRERLERYADDPELAELLARTAPLVGREGPSFLGLAELARLVEYVFGARHALSDAASCGSTTSPRATATRPACYGAWAFRSSRSDARSGRFRA